MSYSDLIHRYFEGELEGEEYLESALFNELHTNPEARQDFRDMLQIRSLCQEDMVSITTPSECTTTVFAQLGFQIPSAAHQSAAAAAAAVRFAGLRRMASYLLTAALASAFTAAAFLYMQPDDANEFSSAGGVPAEELSSNHRIQLDEMPNAPENVPPVVYSYSEESVADGTAQHAGRQNAQAAAGTTIADRGRTPGAENAIDNGAAPVAALRQSPLLGDASMPAAAAFGDNAEAATSQDTQAKSLLETISTAAAIDGNLPAGAAAVQDGNAPRGFAIAGIDLSMLENKRIRVSFRRISSNSSYATDVTENPSGNTFLLDNAIGVSYQFDDYNAFGVEFGQEIYGQEFATEYRGLPGVAMQQRPALYWIGVNHRYDLNAFLELPDDLKLFEQTLLGAHNAGSGAFTGGMVRAMFGAEYTVFRSLTLSAALEFSGISYSTAVSAMEFSYNTGFTYGMSYKF